MIYSIFVQVLGLIAFLLLLLSYWKDDIDSILNMQLFSGIFFILHYSLLGAYSAVLVYAVELFRDYLYYKTNLDKYIFLGSVPIYLFSLIFTYKSIVSVLPPIAAIIDGYGLSIKKETAVICAILCEMLWLYYDYSIGSYIGILTSIILIVSDSIVFVRDRFKI